MAVVLLKELKVPYIVAKADNELHGTILEKVGADKVVYPERDMAYRTASMLTAHNIVDQIKLSKEFQIAEIQPSAKLVGKTVGELRQGAKNYLYVYGLKRNKDILIEPRPETVIEKNDVLVVLANLEAVKNLESD